MMDRQSLVSAIRAADRSGDQEWLSSLIPRKIDEIEHHDIQKATDVTVSLSPKDARKRHGNDKYYSTVMHSRRFMEEWIRERSPDKVVLDYACGNGGNALRAAAAGATLAIGLDISPVSLENGRRTALDRGLERTTVFVQGDCEDTRFPTASIDVMICTGMLHHLDLSYAFPEMRRILKPGGVCLAVEALDYNPLTKVYRKLTPAMRTPWEKDHILSLADLRFARRFFEVGDVKYWHLFSVMMTPFRNSPVFGAGLRLANTIDSIALRIPLVGLMAWQFTFVLTRRQD